MLGSPDLFSTSARSRIRRRRKNNELRSRLEAAAPAGRCNRHLVRHAPGKKRGVEHLHESRVVDSAPDFQRIAYGPRV